MSLKVKDFCIVMEKIAPRRLKEDYDNVGLMVGEKETEVSNILVALDCTMEVIEEAIKKDCNLIFTHHPLLFRKPSSITDDTLIGKKIIKLIKNDISLYSSHTNLDSVCGGINDALMDLLHLERSSVIQPSIGVKQGNNENGIGRFISLNEGISLKDLCIRMKEALNMPYVRFVGDENKVIHNIAVINGSGQDFFNKAKSMGADCIITGDTTYHYVSDFCEMNISIIDGGHFYTEWSAFKAIIPKVKEVLEKRGFDNSIIISECSKDPYKLRQI